MNLRRGVRHNEYRIVPKFAWLPTQILRVIVRAKQDAGWRPTQIEEVWVFMSRYWQLQQAFVRSQEDIGANGWIRPRGIGPYRDCDWTWDVKANFADREDMLSACNLLGIDPDTGRMPETILAIGQPTPEEIREEELRRSHQNAVISSIEVERL
jgi:hypothetical protein